MKNNIILTDCIIPVGYDSFIHRFHILERPVAEADDVPMVKMGVRCKEHLAAVKLKVHFFSIYAHHCVVGKFGKDFPTIQLLVRKVQ